MQVYGYSPYANFRVPVTKRQCSGTWEAMQSQWPEWHLALKVAKTCMASLYVNESHRGAGVFLKPDVLLIPRHLLNNDLRHSVCGLRLEELVRDVRIHYSDDQLCYAPTTVLHLLEDGREKDYCLIKLATSLPCSVPQVTYNSNHEQALFAEILDNGEVMVSIVTPCSISPDHMCSSALNWTRPGSSGGIYLDMHGQLIGIHLSQATGLCDPHTGEERKFLFAHELMKNSAFFTTLDQDFCPLPRPSCISPVVRDLCYLPQVDVRVETKMDARRYFCRASERHLTHSQRAIQIEILQQTQNKKTKKWENKKVVELSYQIFLIDPKGRERENIHNNKATPSSYTKESAVDFYQKLADAIHQNFSPEEPLVDEFDFAYKKCDFRCRFIAN